MPGKGVSINIRSLFLNLSTTHENLGTRVIASLDAKKAFNSVKWDFLWEILRCYGFGHTFLHWIQILYRAPRAQVHTNEWLLKAFPLYQGTRQRCPLSPSLFALEPLAILIRMSFEVRGLRVGTLEEKLSL